jgi:hypothetical protein
MQMGDDALTWCQSRMLLIGRHPLHARRRRSRLGVRPPPYRAPNRDPLDRGFPVGSERLGGVRVPGVPNVAGVGHDRAVMPPAPLSDGTVTLRAWRAEDAGWYAAQSRDPDIQRFTTDPPDLDVPTVRAAIEQFVGAGTGSKSPTGRPAT